MIGRRLETQRPPPWMALLFGALGAGLLAAAPVTGDLRFAIGAILPVLLALGLLWSREPSFAARFGPTSIDVEDPPASIPYATIEGLRARGRPRVPGRLPFAIDVAHSEGLLRIPARLSMPSEEVYAFLLEQVGYCGSRSVNPTLAEYLERQERMYGADRVWTYCASSRRSIRSAHRSLRAVCAALIVTGIAWAGIGFSQAMESPWGPIGIICAVFGSIFFLASFAPDAPIAPAIKKWRASSLVIGPDGLAMVQGEVQGDLRWGELLEIRMIDRSSSSFRLSSAPSAILLRVHGATILVPDIYDRPLHVIYDRIFAHRGVEDSL